MLGYINGVILPGGSVWFDDTPGGYVEAGRLIMTLAEEMNSKGDYFPVWGTCLGFELMTYHYNNGKELRVNCSAYNESSPLVLTPDAQKSQIFSEATYEILDLLETKNTTSNFHHFCITPKDFQESQLGDDWTVFSKNTDDFGVEYISTIEHKYRPYFATQWHPEKPLYEWGHFNIPHDQYTSRVSQFFASFVVNQARRNNHKFPTEDMERQHLIYNFPATFGHATSTYTQLYFFD